MVMSPFRRNVRADTRRTGGRGSKGAIYERLRLPQDVPTPFVLIRAEYVDRNPAPEEIEMDPATGRPTEVKKPYHKSRKHTRKLMVNSREKYIDEVCSAGVDAHNPQPCVGCYAMDNGDKSVGVKDNHAFGSIHLVPYHKHPLLDRQTGGIVLKKDNSGPVLVDDECVGRTCNFCRVLQGQPPIINEQTGPWPGYRREDIQTVFGKRRYIEVGKNHLQDLMGWDAAIASTCPNDGSQLITDSWNCPQCNGTVIDMENDPRTDEQIIEATSRPYPCLTCQRQVFLVEKVSCDVCEAQNPPRQTVQRGLFDVVLWGCKQGQNTNSHLMLSRFESLEQFDMVIQRQFGPILQGKRIQQILQELARPYDFDQVYAPRSLQDQATRLSLPVPPSAGGYGTPAYSNAQAPQTMAPVPGYAPVQPAPMAPVNGAPTAGSPQPPPFVPPTRGGFAR